MSGSAAEQFDRVAQAYATSAVHAKGPDLAWLLEALQPEPAWRALDLGTGAGHAAMAVAPYVDELYAVDVSARMLTTAADLAGQRNLTNTRFAEASVSALPWPNGYFDAAFSRYSAHHWSSLAPALREAARLTRPGAPLIIIDTISPEEPALDTFVNTLELLRDPSHGRNASAQEWTRQLQQAGFAVQAIRTWQLELVTAEWLERARTEVWRAVACYQLLREAPDAARAAFAIAGDGSRFSLHCALFTARHC
ncbi:MAG TPA: class I SAM-dependent methyltransferase [Chloroflexota bacterium]|nr:class I SAM-dependent methyltransferase [Chloroflexota bacterium]